MKFIDYLQSIAGISVYPLISLFIFFIFFLLLIIYVFRAKKEHIIEMQNLPLDQENQSH